MKHKLLLIIALSFFGNVHLSVADSSASEADPVAASEFIEGSYLLTFKEPTSGEESFVKAHSKEEIAQLLQINGQIESIFETINTIHVFMDAEEAARLSNDSRVLNVEQDAIVTSMPVQESNASQFPQYKDGILTIPRVDTEAQPGQYQDVKLQLTEQGTWILLDYKAVSENVSLADLDSVYVAKSNAVPIQVFLVARGQLRNGCSAIGQINQRLDSNQFNVIASVISGALEGMSCTQALIPFEKVIPLDVYGLKAGAYSYDVNGITGTFELVVDNTLPIATSVQFGSIDNTLPTVITVQ